MIISLILAHADPSSFNHAIAQSALAALKRNGHRVYFHDLYQERFDPILPAAEIPKDGPLTDEVAQYCHELSESDGLVIVHPNWWGQPPAILKGWIDRVMRPGVAYEFKEGDSGEGIPVGLLKARSAVVFNTANTPADREQSAFGDPLQRLWHDCIFDLCGVTEFYREMFTVIVTSTPQERRSWLKRVNQVIDDFYPADKNRSNDLEAQSERKDTMISEGINVIRWPENRQPDETGLRRLMADEDLYPYTWSNAPGDRYGAHSHSYHKVIYVVSGSITFGLPDKGKQVDLNAGDRLELPAGVKHDALVGPRGVMCLEAHRPS